MLTRNDFMPFLGLRGWLSVLVITTHFILLFMKVDQTASFRSFLGDYQITMLFFLMAGMVMVLAKEDEFSSWAKIKSFWHKRIARMPPVYWLSVALRLPLFAAYYSWRSDPWIFYHVLLSVVSGTQVFGPQAVVLFFFNPSLWQIGVIFWCNVLAPFLVPRIRRLSVTGLMIGFCVCWLIPVVVFEAMNTFIDGHTSSSSSFFVYCHFLVRAPHFYAGVFAGFLLEAFLANDRKLSPIWNWIVDLGAVAMVLGRHVDFLLQNYWVMPLHCLWLAAMLISGDGCWTRRLLTSRPLCLLGLISYSTGCLHMIVLYGAVWFKFGTIPIGHSPFVSSIGFFVFDWYDICWVLPLCLLVAMIAHRYFEEPMASYILK